MPRKQHTKQFKLDPLTIARSILISHNFNVPRTWASALAPLPDGSHSTVTMTATFP